MIVYFDGHCSLCNGAIDFLIRRDHARRLRFAPLQGKTARRHLPSAFIDDLNTVVLETNGHFDTESTAALRTVAALGRGYRLALILLIVPRWIRDPAYRFIARHRYQWFGRRETCRLPTPAEREVILD